MANGIVGIPVQPAVSSNYAVGQRDARSQNGPQEGDDNRGSSARNVAAAQTGGSGHPTRGTIINITA